MSEATPPGAQIPRALTASVIIVTYRRPEHVRECLRCVAVQTHRPNMVVVVDASPDDATREVVAGFDSVFYLRNPRGAGTTATSRDIGLRATTGDVVVFFDDDARPDPDCVEQLLSPYSGANVGGVGGRTSNGIEGEMDEGGGQIGMLLPNGTLTGYFAGDPGYIIEVDHLLGANMSWRRQALLDLGGIRDLYPGTCLREETDIALRVRAAGWRVLYNPAAHARHMPGPYAKGKRFDRRYAYYAQRNHLVLLLTNLGPGSPEVRRYLRLASGDVGRELARAARGFVEVHRGDTARAARTVCGGTLRASALASGCLVGLQAGTRAMLAQRHSPVRPLEPPRDDVGNAA